MLNKYTPTDFVQTSRDQEGSVRIFIFNTDWLTSEVCSSNPLPPKMPQIMNAAAIAMKPGMHSQGRNAIPIFLNQAHGGAIIGTSFGLELLNLIQS